MKRRTEINIELRRTLLIRHHDADPCECAKCVAQGKTVAPIEAAVLIDVNTRTLFEGSEADHDYFVENADSGEAIEIESAEGQLILAAAVRSLEQRLSAQARAALAVPPAPPAAWPFCFSRSLYAKLHWLRNIITHPTSTRHPRKEN